MLSGDDFHGKKTSNGDDLQDLVTRVHEQPQEQRISSYLLPKNPKKLTTCCNNESLVEDDFQCGSTISVAAFSKVLRTTLVVGRPRVRSLRLLLVPRRVGKCGVAHSGVGTAVPNKNYS